MKTKLGCSGLLAAGLLAIPHAVPAQVLDLKTQLHMQRAVNELGSLSLKAKHCGYPNHDSRARLVAVMDKLGYGSEDKSTMLAAYDRNYGADKAPNTASCANWSADKFQEKVDIYLSGMRTQR